MNRHGFWQVWPFSRLRRGGARRRRRARQAQGQAGVSGGLEGRGGPVHKVHGRVRVLDIQAHARRARGGPQVGERRKGGRPQGRDLQRPAGCGRGSLTGGRRRWDSHAPPCVGIYATEPAGARPCCPETMSGAAPGPVGPAGRGRRIGTLPPRRGRCAKAGRRIPCRPRGGGKVFTLPPSCPRLNVRSARAAGRSPRAPD